MISSISSRLGSKHRDYLGPQVHDNLFKESKIIKMKKEIIC